MMMMMILMKVIMMMMAVVLLNMMVMLVQYFQPIPCCPVATIASAVPHSLPIVVDKHKITLLSACNCDTLTQLTFMDSHGDDIVIMTTEELK